MTGNEGGTPTWLDSYRRNRHLRLALKFEALASTMSPLEAFMSDQERIWGRWKGLADYHRERFNELDDRRKT